MPGVLKLEGTNIATGDGNGVVTLSSGINFPAGTITNWQHQRTTITTAQNLGTSYETANGSSISYTPATGASYVYYSFHFLASGETDGDDFLLHGKVRLDSNDETGSNFTLNLDYTTDGVQSVYTIPFVFTAWSGAKTIDVQMREYGPNNTARLHQTIYLDGGTPTNYYYPIVTIYSVM